MKIILAGLCSLFLSVKGFSQKEIKAEEARNNVGDTVKICTKIVDAVFDETAKGSPTILYISNDNTATPISFIIWADKRKFFDYKPDKDLKERDVCITGKIELYKEKPVIIIDKQSQVDIK